MQKIVARFIAAPKKLFLLDSIGAFITAFFLIAILNPLEAYFGMSPRILTSLSAIAIAFCIYSICCFLLLKENYIPFLRIISIANFFYACLTFSLVIQTFSSLTILGINYFILEILIVLVLVFIEYKTLSGLQKKHKKSFL